MDTTRSTPSMKKLGLLLIGCFVAVPLAAAPVLGQVSFRPLTIGQSLKVTRAFGPDDEDCVFVAQRQPGASGSQTVRTLICQ